MSRGQRIALIVVVASLVAVAVALLLSRQLVQRDDGLVRLELGADELFQIVGQVDVEETDEPSMGEVAEGDQRTIQGVVLRPSGEPAAGATLTAQAAESDVLFETSTDQGGAFSFEELPEGLFLVEASLDGFGPAVAVGIRPGGGRLRLTLVSGREIFGFVSLADGPAAGAAVHIGAAGLFPQRSVRTDNAGRFRLAGLRPGRYEYIATLPGHGSGFRGPLVIEEGQSGETRLDISLERGVRATVRVLDAQTRQPIPGAVVTVAERPLHVLAVHQVLDDGVSDIDWLPRGVYHARVRAPGYLPWEGPLQVGWDPGDREVLLSRGATIEGRVRNAANNAIAGAQIAVYVETPQGARWELRRTLFEDFHRLVRPDGSTFWVPSLGFVSTRSGTFTLPGLPSGDAWVVVEHPDHAPAVVGPLQLTSDETTGPLDVVLTAPRRIRGRVEDGQGAGVPRAVLSYRHRRIPNWAARDAMIASGLGAFDIPGLPGEIVLMVRHPDFAPLELDLAIPEGGLDDLILQLSGDSLVPISGRVFTERGDAARGATVWLMRGRSELPVCRATVEETGWFRATQCTAPPERMIVAAAEHAPLMADFGGHTEPRDWRLRTGGELEVVSQRTPVVVTVQPVRTLPAALWPRPAFELDRWQRHRIRFMAPGPYDVECRAEGFTPRLVRVEVEDGQRTEALCPSLERRTSFPVYVVDRLGTPIADALVMIDGLSEPVRTQTDARGRIDVETSPGTWATAEAFHERWGRGELVFYAPFRPPSEPFRIVLEDSIAGDDPDDRIDELRAWGILAVHQPPSVQVDLIEPGSPAAGSGLRRGDYLLWARSLSEVRYSVGVRRRGEIYSFELVRDPGSLP